MTSKGGARRLLLLRQDAAQTGPVWRGECAEEKPAGWRAGCAPVRCQHTDVLSANLRSALANPQGRMPGGRAIRGVLSLVTFFAQALRRRSGANSAAGPEGAEGRMPGVKKVTRSAAGRVEAVCSAAGRVQAVCSTAGQVGALALDAINQTKMASSFLRTTINRDRRLLPSTVAFL